jgi:hypothetical protein
MNSGFKFVLISLIAFLSFSCSKPKEGLTHYLATLTGQELETETTYLVVSDFGCSSCKEEVFHRASLAGGDTVYIITDPRNTSILIERFHEPLATGRVVLDSLKLNRKFGILVPKPIVIHYQGNDWISEEYPE